MSVQSREFVNGFSHTTQPDSTIQIGELALNLFYDNILTFLDLGGLIFEFFIIFNSSDFHTLF